MGRLDYSCDSKHVVGTSRDCGAYGGVLRHRGGTEPSVALGISRSPARPRGTLIEPVGQDTDVCLWVDVCGRWRIRSGLDCAAAAGSTCGCDGDHSVRSHNRGNAVFGREPRSTMGMDRYCHPDHTRSTGRRSGLQTPQTACSTRIHAFIQTPEEGVESSHDFA